MLLTMAELGKLTLESSDGIPQLPESYYRNLNVDSKREILELWNKVLIDHPQFIEDLGHRMLSESDLENFTFSYNHDFAEARLNGQVYRISGQLLRSEWGQ